jgi:hypothetical protein
MQSLENPFISMRCRLELRRLKGRPVGTLHQYDAGTGRFRKMVHPDPLLDLYTARSNARLGPAHAERYGVVRQTVVSPVVLP